MPKVGRRYGSLEKNRERRELQRTLKKINRAYDNLLFAEKLPSRVGELRSAIRQKIVSDGGKMTLKTLDQYKKYWHPKERESLLTFRSYGGIVGRFYPSAEGSDMGIVYLKDQGMFPAELSPYCSKNSRKKLENEDQKFCCWLRGTEKDPFYTFVLDRPCWSESSVIRRPFFFRIQGLIVKRNKDQVWVRIIENIEEPEVSFLVPIWGFDLKIQKGKQFWVMDCYFKERKLVFNRGVRVD
ncbi:MAG: hypothetical protein AB4372_35890 [Xenococcus sp. (in: cyanobacteria)]